MGNKPPCELDSVDGCTPKSALECLRLVQKIPEGELPTLYGQSQLELQEPVNRQIEAVRKCLMERFTSGQFDAPEKPEDSPK